jgi:predicted acetyltransferase
LSLNELEVREALVSEYESIYMMGYDIWGEGLSRLDYLDLSMKSVKYQKGQWYVLKNKSTLLSSLIIYRFSEKTFGIGSIATPCTLRRQGFASQLILDRLNFLKKELKASAIFLYSDIDPGFYEKMGFQKLPKKDQKYKTTICMVYRSDPEKEVTGDSVVPEYF